MKLGVNNNSNVKRLSVDGMRLVFQGVTKRDALSLIKKINTMIGPMNRLETTTDSHMEELAF